MAEESTLRLTKAAAECSATSQSEHHRLLQPSSPQSNQTEARPGDRRVVLLGANGMFGKRLAMLLSAQPGLYILLAGRRIEALQTLADQLASHTQSKIEVSRLDLDASDCAQRLIALAPDIVIDTCGPFQQRDYWLPRLAIRHRFHYIDLADAPDFVAGIGALDDDARTAGVLIVSGASTVPALSGAVIDAHTPQFAALSEIDIGITPGNRAERGLATVRSILSSVGRPHAQFEEGRLIRPPAWTSLRCHPYAAPVGRRWLAYCAVADVLLLPKRYPGLQRLHVRAGLELKRMHFGLWLLGWLVRLRLLSSLLPWATRAQRISEYWLSLGSDNGAMHVRLRGSDRQGKALDIEWQLIAEQGDGPYVPAAAAAALVRLLAEDRITQRGAMPCIGLLTLEDFKRMLSGRAIRFLSDVEQPGS